MVASNGVAQVEIPSIQNMNKKLVAHQTLSNFNKMPVGAGRS